MLPHIALKAQARTTLHQTYSIPSTCASGPSFMSEHPALSGDLILPVQPARTALAAGCEGIRAINTITSIMAVNLDTLRPEPCVEG